MKNLRLDEQHDAAQRQALLVCIRQASVIITNVFSPDVHILRHLGQVSTFPTYDLAKS